MKDFNWESLKNNNAVHCDTEEKVRDFLRQACKYGFRWNEEDFYRYYGVNTCFYVWSWGYKKLGFSYVAYFQENNYNIIEWEIDNMKEFTEQDLKVGMLVETKCGKRAIVMPYRSDRLVLAYEDASWSNIYFDGDFDYSIVKVWRSHFCIDFTDSYRTLLYVRKETKEMTVEEISKKLGYNVKIVKER